MRKINPGHLCIAAAIVAAAILYSFRPSSVRVELPPTASDSDSKPTKPSYRSPDFELHLTDSGYCSQIRIKYVNGTETLLEAGKGDLARYRGLYPSQGDSFLVIHLVSKDDAFNSAKDRMLVPYTSVASVTCNK